MYMNAWRSKVNLLVFVVAVAFFLWASYWIVVSVRATAQLIEERAFFIEHTKVGWWTAIFYATEVTPSLGILFRWIASLFALYPAVILIRRPSDFASASRKAVRNALFFEGANYLTLIPAVISGFTYPFVGDLWYYGSTPGIVVFLLNGLATLSMVAIIPFSVFKLRSKIVHGVQEGGIIRWACLTGAAYLFVFWFTYTLSWISSLVPWSARAQPGLEILLNPLDLASFILTVFFLLAVMLYGWAALLPAAKKQTPPNMGGVGITMVGLGIYYGLILVIYALFGGYYAHPTVWMEILGPNHNPDMWCVSLIPLGLYLTIRSKR